MAASDRNSDHRSIIARPLEAGIRQYVPVDLAGVMDLEDIAYRPIDVDQFLDLVRRPLSDCWVAESGGEIVGYAMGSCQGNTVILERLVVHPDHERRGIGTRLLRRFESRTQSVQRIVEVTVPERALGIQELLKHCGYTCCSVYMKHFVDPFEDGYVFCKSFVPDDPGRDFAVYSPNGRRLERGKRAKRANMA